MFATGLAASFTGRCDLSYTHRALPDESLIVDIHHVEDVPPAYESRPIWRAA